MEQLVQNAEGNLSIRNIQPPTKRKPTALLSREEKQKQQQVAEARKKYGRGRPVRLNQVKDKKLRSRLRHIEDKYQDAILGAKDAEILLENQEGFLQPESELERTYKVRQDDITEAIGVQQAKKSFELKLDLGPYTANYTRNGKQLLLAGQKGHIATCDWRSGRPGCELNLNETVRDAKWLHNDQYFAVAQKKHVYIYDAAGVEIHVLRKYVETSHLEFLPYHFLLAGVENSGFLRYTDTSTGQIVAEHPTRRSANSTGTKPIQRYSACWSPEWHRVLVVTQQHRRSCQDTSERWCCPVHCCRQIWSLHAHWWSRLETQALGY